MFLQDIRRIKFIEVFPEINPGMIEI